STSGNGNSPDGRDHWPYCYTSVIGGAGIKRGVVYGESDRTASAPRKDPVHPGEILATIYTAFGIDPHTLVNNHLNQPRELVQAEPVTQLFAYQSSRYQMRQLTVVAPPSPGLRAGACLGDGLLR